MHLAQELKGLICIIFGLMLIIWGAGQLLLQLGIALLGIALIAYGIQVRSGVPFFFRIQRWFVSRRF